MKHAIRDHSRVLEINPVTLEIVWQYTSAEAGFSVPTDSYKFYSPYISSAQRLPNGNTLITEGSNGRLFEVTAEHELVWEYVSPYTDGRNTNMVYRSYRVPYQWVPQLEKPQEVAIEAIDVSTYRVPGAAPKGSASIVSVETTLPFVEGAACVATSDEGKSGG